MTVRVLIVDDHPVVRSGVAALLASDPALTVMAAAGSAEEALQAEHEHRPDVVLSDLRLGTGMDGVELTRSLLAQQDPPAVVILTTYDYDADIVRAVEAGAAGYLLKDASPDVILAAVHAAAAGEPITSPQLNERVLGALRAHRVALSQRELETLELVAAGLSNRQIAKTMFVTEATVKTHLNHVFTKLGVDNRTAAVAQARSAGLLR